MDRISRIKYSSMVAYRRWLDEEIEDGFEVSEIEQFGRHQFDYEVCKIATVIANELGLQ